MIFCQQFSFTYNSSVLKCNTSADQCPDECCARSPTFRVYPPGVGAAESQLVSFKLNERELLPPLTIALSAGTVLNLMDCDAGTGLINTEAAASYYRTCGVFFAEFFFWNHDISQIPDMKILTPSKTATTTSINYDDNGFLGLGCPHDRFSARFTGFISIQTEGQYVFYTTSDDGSQLFIGEQMVVNNDGIHGAVKRYGYKYMTPGFWPVTVLFFENGGGAYLRVSYYGPDTNNAETLLTVAVCSRHVRCVHDRILCDSSSTRSFGWGRAACIPSALRSGSLPCT